MSNPSTTDPLPWKHAGGERVSDSSAPNAPIGGYTYLPRPGYSDHENRYTSTRSPEHAARMARADALAVEAQQKEKVQR